MTFAPAPRLRHPLGVLRSAAGIEVSIPQIIVAVSVSIAVIGAVVLGVVWIVPWAEDNSAKSEASTIQSAEQLFHANSNAFGSRDALSSNTSTPDGTAFKALSDNPAEHFAIATSDDGYCLGIESRTGRFFWSSSESQTITQSAIAPAASGTAPACPSPAVIDPHSAAASATWSIPDPALHAWVVEALGKGDGTAADDATVALTEADAAALDDAKAQAYDTSTHWFGAGVGSFAGFQDAAVTHLGAINDSSASLVNLNGLQNIRSSASIVVSGAALTSISLPDLTTLQAVNGSAGGLQVSGAALTSISLPKLATIPTSFTISGASLTSVDLRSLVSIGTDALITSTKLTSVDLPALTTIGGQLTVSNNGQLADLSGFNALTHVTRVAVASDSQLTDISGFNALTSLGEGTTVALSVTGNTALIQITGFHSLTSVSGTLSIQASVTQPTLGSVPIH
ncbi:hypothetical protein [Gryllotalpicola protaetiae]|uniref:Leucine-rich repeat domain-containing protein n=1 Tax=Gryllotalpicola protaetiae TaxID=2419771 RepID=A0A387BYK0_9MICO|nr:hypothetical protein [Gryllotalpicola protaetiae]AYG03421.1 hypothetical protein D7I44_07650 [Gryllotalpicola protaetiae]